MQPKFAMLLGDFQNKTVEPVTPPDDLSIRLYREPFSDEFILTIPNGSHEPVTEIMGAEDTRKWFSARGCKPEKLEKALDYAWEYSFYRPVFIRVAFLNPPVSVSGVSPRV